MSARIINPYGDEIEIFTDGEFFIVESRNKESYVSIDMEAVIAAFIEDVYENNQVFHSLRTNITYRAIFSEILTAKNKNKTTYVIVKNTNYINIKN